MWQQEDRGRAMGARDECTVSCLDVVFLGVKCGENCAGLVTFLAAAVISMPVRALEGEVLKEGTGERRRRWRARRRGGRPRKRVSEEMGRSGTKRK